MILLSNIEQNDDPDIKLQVRKYNETTVNKDKGLLIPVD